MLTNVIFCYRLLETIPAKPFKIIDLIILEIIIYIPISYILTLSFYGVIFGLAYVFNSFLNFNTINTLAMLYPLFISGWYFIIFVIILINKFINGIFISCFNESMGLLI
jgi:hypothetical protein